MLAKCFGEFMGTAVLILLGDGVVANVLLRHRPSCRTTYRRRLGWNNAASDWSLGSNPNKAIVAGAVLPDQ